MICLVIFLDDVMVLAQSKEELEAQMKQVVQLCNLLGFLINQEKSQVVPTWWIQFLGFFIRLQEHGDTTDPEDTTTSSELQRDLDKGNPVSERTGQAHWKDDGHCSISLRAPLWYRNLQRSKEPSITKL